MASGDTTEKVVVLYQADESMAGRGSIACWLKERADGISKHLRHLGVALIVGMATITYIQTTLSPLVACMQPNRSYT